MTFVTRVNKVEGPRNNRAVAVAQHRLTQITPLAQKEWLNSIAVNGWPSVIYNRLTAGRTCSCSVKIANAPDQVEIFDERGNASQEHIHTLLTGGRFSIQDYGPINNKGNDPNPEPVFLPNVIAASGAGNRVASEANNDRVGFDVGDPLATLVEELVDAEASEANPDAYDNNGCQVCYGTGFVGGFRILNGVRMVIDARFPTLTLVRSQVVQTETPFAIEFLGNDASAEWVLAVPKTLTWTTYKVWNNRDHSRARLELLDESGESPQWVPATVVTMRQACTGLPTRFRIVGQDGERFTHVELQGVTGKLIQVEFPTIQKGGTTNNILDGTQDVDLNFGANVPVLNPGDIVADSVLGLSWRIVSRGSQSDGQRRTVGWTASARVVQPFERIHNLPIPDAKQAQPAVLNRLLTQPSGNVRF